MSHSRTWILSLMLAAGCTAPDADTATEGAAEAGAPTGLDAVFATAADELGVPAGALHALAFADTVEETGPDPVVTDPAAPPAELTDDADPAGFWVVDLSPGQLARATALTGISEDDVRADPLANARAAAAVLAEYATKLGGDWAAATARYLEVLRTDLPADPAAAAAPVSCRLQQWKPQLFARTFSAGSALLTCSRKIYGILSANVSYRTMIPGAWSELGHAGTKATGKRFAVYPRGSCARFRGTESYRTYAGAEVYTRRGGVHLWTRPWQGAQAESRFVCPR
jgi:hypothetical protein